MASPAGARVLNCDGNDVVNMIIIAVMAGRLPPGMLKYFVTKPPALQTAKATASAVAICSTGSLSLRLDPSFIVPSVKIFCYITNVKSTQNLK